MTFHLNTPKYCPQCASDLIEVELNGRPRLKCSAVTCNYVYWDNPTPVVAAVVEYSEKVILVRNKGWPEKWYGLIAGFLERGETPESGVLREIREELGLNGQIVDLIGVYPFFELNQLILAFHVIAEGDIALGDELEAYKLLSPGEIRPWRLGTGQALQKWLETHARQTDGKD